MIIIDTPLEPFYKISIDTVGPLPKTPSGNKHILTIQDNLTKYCIGVLIPNTRAETVADGLARNVISIYGCPRILPLHRAPSFLSKLMQKLTRIFKIEKVNTGGHRTQSNAGIGRSHGMLTEFLNHYIDQFDDWDNCHV